MTLVALIALAASLACSLPASGATPSRSEPEPLQYARGMVVDPGTGRVFIAVGDHVEVRGADGSQLASITELYGAWAMDTANGFVWVAESTMGVIAKIDPTSMTIVKTYAVGTTVGDNLAVVGQTAWFGSNRGSSLGLFRLDLATSAVVKVGTGGRDYVNPRAVRLGDSTADVLVIERTDNSGPMHRVSTAAPYASSADGISYAYYNGTQTVTSDGSKIWVVSGRFFDSIQEFDAATLKPTGSLYRAKQWITGVAASPGHAGEIVGLGDGSFFMFAQGVTSPIAQVPHNDDDWINEVALSPDGDTGYALGVGLQVFDLRPAVTAVSPSSVVRDVPNVVTLDGRSLGGINSVSVGGVAASLRSGAPGEVSFAMPRGVSVGSQPVALHGPTGDAEASITVVANTGSVLNGTVRLASTPVAGAVLSLTGPGLASPLVINSGSGGTYAFPPQGYGTTYALSVHDPAGRAPDQMLRHLVLTPNAPTTVDVDLSRPPPGEAEARVDLGLGAATDLLVDPTSGNVWVSVGDEVDVFDKDGNAVARVGGLSGAGSMALLGNGIYVGLANQGRIVRIDRSTLAVTGSWPLGVSITGSIAAANNRIWFAAGDHSPSSLEVLNPVSGLVNDASFQAYQQTLTGIQGDANRFIDSQAGTNAYTDLFDGTTLPPTLVVGTTSGAHPTVPTSPLAANGSTNRVYDSSGYEFDLSTLANVGVHYPAQGPPAYSPGVGGVVAIGSSVFKAGTATATYQFAGTATFSDLNSAGTRLYRIVGHELVLDDLVPMVTAVAPQVIHPNSTVSFTGQGLGAATAVTVDGTPTVYQKPSPSSISVTLDHLPAGIHRVVVATPWGQSAPAAFEVDAESVPAAPQNATSAATSGNRVTISWQSPADDGGLTISGYKVTASPGSKTCSTAGALTCNIFGLTPGSTVTFTVTAANSLGNSPPSSATTPLFIPTAPDPPTDVIAQSGSRQVSIQWTPPLDNGGMNVYSYQVCRSTDPAMPVAASVCSARSGTSAAFGSLASATTYYFTVAATNLVGTGAPSTVTTAVTPYAVPVAPTLTAAIRGDGQAAVGWTAPTDTGGSNVTGYVVTPYIASTAQTPRTFTGTATSHWITGLRNGTTYTFTVAATNAIGTGLESLHSKAVTPSAVPGVPTITTAVRGDGRAAVGWTAPASDGGAPIYSYVVTPYKNGVAQPAQTFNAGHSQWVTGLANGTTYTFRVAAKNAAGTSAKSGPSAPVTPSGVPTAPNIYNVVAQNGRVALYWHAPSNTNGAPIYSYVVTPYKNGVAQPTRTFNAALQQYVTGLTNGTTYTFRVAAKNAAGRSALSAASTPSTPHA
ncbi:MAG: hypothetical protein JWM05_3718 [Acidimicrobiales bacterium]|nr:hypothetical protein [Acidimicrobiales bacterium]